MSPEQLRGAEVTAKSDIYALGLVLYELFTGKRPFEAKTIPQLIDQQEAAELTSMTEIAADIDPGVERIIRNCLNPDPHKRPTSALSVAAALPGADPLAAALAAGETPSPEMVASAGHSEGLERKYSIPLLAVVLICLLAAPALKDRKNALQNTALDFPPDVLSQKARELAVSFGYPDKPADSVVWLSHRAKLLEHFNSLPEPKLWKTWLAAEAPMSAFYREAPKPLAASPEGNVTATNPPPLDPGMVQMELDGHGRLRGFSAVPYLPGHELVNAIRPEAVFEAAQLDLGKFTQVPAKTVPQSAADELRAWRGPHPVVPNTELTVEMASWRGRLTHVKFIWPWMKGDGSTPQEKSFVAKLRGVLLLATALIGLAFAALLARRNWKMGRVDRKGARRIAIVQFGMNLIVWVGKVHPVPNDTMLSFFFNAAAQLMLPSFLLWLLYIALEPALRSRWPHSIVTWNRILAGRWTDPQVGAHILIGAAVGVGIWVAASLNELRTLSKDGLESGGYLFVLEGTRQWVAANLSTMTSALQSGLIVFFLIFGLRMIFRKDWIAAIAGSFLFAFVLSDVASSRDWMVRLVIYVLIYSVIIAVLLRFGLVVTMVTLFFINTIGSTMIGSDLTTWYTATGFATMALLLGITLFAFARSLLRVIGT